MVKVKRKKTTFNSVMKEERPIVNELNKPDNYVIFR